MKTKILSIMFLLLLAIISSCSFKDSVKITNFSPRGEVKNLTTFTIEFSENLAPLEKQNVWLSDEFVQFEPKIAGKFKWVSGNTLIFSPDYPLQPIQSYEADVTNKVLFGKDLSLDSDTYEFNTPNFDALQAEFFWAHVPNQKFKISIKANLHFNYPVNPGMLKEYLHIERGGEEVKDFQIVSDNSAEVIAINLGEITQTDKEQEIKLTIKEGLLSIAGKEALAEDRVFKYDLPPITKLAITGVSAGLDDDKLWIEVLTTQMVDEKRIKEFVKVDQTKNLSFYINENSFRINGDFDPSQIFNLKIMKGLPGLYGGELEFDFEQEVSFVNLNPSLSFADKKGKYLMLGGQRNLQVNAINIPGADLEVYQVFKNNLIHFLNQYSYLYENDYGGETDFYFYDGDIDRYGRSLYKESISLSNNPNRLEKFTINLDPVFTQKQKGVFVAQVRSVEDRWLNTSKMIAVTDLAIIAKKSENEIIVFANSIEKAEPERGVVISIISSNNQLLFEGKTGSDGSVRFKDVKEKTKDFTLRAVTAEKGDDFNYIDLRETEIETSRFDVGGQVELSSGYKTFIYGDRNLYRTGEQVNISGIVRDDATKVIKDVPVIVKIISPNGKIFDEFKKILNTEGSFEISFKVPEYVQTGQYRAEVYTGSESLIGSYSFSVEDFVPDKIRLLLNCDKKSASPGEAVKFSINAEYLFGAKASGLKYEADVQIKHRQFSSSKYPSFNFGGSNEQNSNLQNTFVDGTLNDNGEAEFSFVPPADLKSSGIVTVYAFVSVFDLSGRTVNRSASFDVYPKKHFIGIKSSGYYYGTNENINFKLIALDKNENEAKNFKAVAKLVRYEWQTVLRKDQSDRYFYNSEKKEILVWEKDVDLSGGEKNLSVVASVSGDYELRISSKGESSYHKKEFYAYGWSSNTASSFQVNKEGRVEIVFDKQVYDPSEKAKILFTTPFDGTMLVTIERSGVYDHKYIQVKERSAQLELPLKDLYVPNVYLTATLFKKHTLDNTAPFLVGHGYASMKVEKKDLKLPVSISAPQKIKPNTKVDITVKTSEEKDIYVTLAAVDEGILQIKNYLTPDIYGFMFAKRALGVTSYDLYKLLLPEILAMKSSTGGDQLAAQLQKRTNPITTKRYNLISIWSGIRKTDGSGIVKVPINIPQFNGEVRLMAVAYSGSKFGSAELKMKVADDLILEPQIPRFLAPNDSLVMPITLINTTNKSGSVNVSVKTEGPIKLSTKSSQSVTVPPNGTQRVNFAVSAWNETGIAKIVIEASGLAKIKDEINIAVRPISPFITETNSGSVRGGQQINLDIQNNFLKGTKATQLVISKFPAVQFAKQLKYLVGYPHGCVEQTVSKLFPQLYFEDVAKLVAPQYFRSNNPVYYVKEGIKKLESMQLFDGSLSYWPGDNNSNWWGSVYAAHFLVESKKAGFDVSENMLSRLLNYISKKAREKSTYDYYNYNNNSRTSIKTANKEILYSLYVLALAGKGDVSTMNYYKSRPHLVSADSKYLLAGAYALTNQWNSYYEVLPTNYKPEKADRLTGDSFDSEARANAIMLNVLLEVEPTNKQIPYIVKYLSKMMDKIYSTQERSFAFVGLGKAARMSAFTDVKVDVVADGKVIGSSNGNDLTLTIDNKYKSVTLKAGGQGEVYYFINTEGVKTGNVKEKDSQMQVRRSYIDYRTGGEISNGKFYQGQLIVCKINLTGGEFSANNIAITDLIPSGFEIENPRLSASTEQQNYKGNMSVQYMDIRDDRLILFTNLQRGTTQTFYYMLRVVNKGKFVLPVISAEAMYDPEFNSANGKQTIRIFDK